MSKVQQAKEAQGYNPKPVPQTCVNCRHFTIKMETKEKTFGGTWTKETDLRCGIGGFAVKKMATCNKFEKK